MAAGLTAPELRELSVEELATRLRESKEELFNLRFQVPPASWTTTGGCRPSAATSPGSTRSCASASWACRSPRARVWHERAPVGGYVEHCCRVGARPGRPWVTQGPRGARGQRQDGDRKSVVEGKSVDI